jgi:uncharacterized membrane protein YccC
VVLTTREAANCIGSIRIATPVPRLDIRKVYALPELIDIAENASPQGRIAWTEAKRALERAGIDRALYLPLLTFAMQGSDSRVIVPFPKPIAPRGYVIVEEPLAQAQLELQYTLLDFARKSRLEGSRALEIASTLLLNRVHQTIAFNTATQFYRAQETLGQLEAAKTILQTAETLRQSAQSQYDRGRATLPDLQNADAGAAEARYDLADAQGEAKKAKLVLTETAGVEPSVEIQITAQDTESAAEPFEAATVCYVVYNAIAWPGILTCVITVLFTGLSSTGAMKQKQLYRFSGAAIGGILGIATVALLYPNMDSITSLVIVVAGIAMLSAWVLRCPRISCVGVQIGFAFFLTALPGFRATTQIAPARDRIIGVALGILVMWFIFDQLWPTRTSHALERVLLSIGKATSQLSAARQSSSGRLEKSAFERLRAGVSLELTNVQQLEFAAHFEAGRQRKRELARSRRLIRQIEFSAAEFYRLARQVSAD